MIQNLLNSFYLQQINKIIENPEKIQKSVKFNDFAQKVQIKKKSVRKSNLDGRRSIQTLGTAENEEIKIIEFEPILLNDRFVT